VGGFDVSGAWSLLAGRTLGARGEIIALAAKVEDTKDYQGVPVSSGVFRTRRNQTSRVSRTPSLSFGVAPSNRLALICPSQHMTQLNFSFVGKATNGSIPE